MKIEAELRQGMAFAKCRKCGCMKETLGSLGKALQGKGRLNTGDLQASINAWESEMEPIMYACLGCAYCFPAVAMNKFNQAYPEAAAIELSCAFEVKEKVWPPVAGEYRVLCEDGDCSVAVSTLGSVGLADQVAAAHPGKVCIVGKTETENIGIDKVIKNTITNQAIRFLVLAGSDPKGHHPGQTILSLSANGVDEKMRVIGSKGRRPILRNVTIEEIESFRNQVDVVDMIGCEDIGAIVTKIQGLPATSKTSCGCAECGGKNGAVDISDAPTIEANEPDRVELDKAGYFVILPRESAGTILVEHYDYGDKLLGRVEGKDARSLYWTIIEHKWVTQLSHSAYLGKELAKAELSLRLGFKYVQDGA